MEAGERDENLARQEEEAEALAAIYGDDFSSRVGDAGTVWEIRVPLRDPDDPTDAPTLHTRDGTPAPAHLIARVVPIESYPSSTPPLLEVHPPNALTHDRMDECIGAMDESYRDGGDGEVCVFAFVTRLREMAETWVDEDRPGARDGDDDEDVDDAGREEGEAGAHTWDPDALEAELAALAIERSAYDASDDTAVNADNTNGAWTEESLERSIVTGVPFTEKKSTFQGYLLSNVRSVAQVEAMLRALRRNTRIAKCSHLMAAWRIRVSGYAGRRGRRVHVGAGPRRGRRGGRREGHVALTACDQGGGRVRGGGAMVRRDPPRTRAFLDHQQLREGHAGRGGAHRAPRQGQRQVIARVAAQ